MIPAQAVARVNEAYPRGLTLPGPADSNPRVFQGFLRFRSLVDGARGNQVGIQEGLCPPRWEGQRVVAPRICGRSPGGHGERGSGAEQALFLVRSSDP